MASWVDESPEGISANISITSTDKFTVLDAASQLQATSITDTGATVADRAMPAAKSTADKGKGKGKSKASGATGGGGAAKSLADAAPGKKGKLLHCQAPVL